MRDFKANHGTAETMMLDLFNHDNIHSIEKYIKGTNIELHVLVGGPLCQGFSLAGPRAMNDERNSLYTAMVKVAKRLTPKAIVLENVPGLLQLNSGIGAKRIVEDFKELGYKMETKILYAP